ncbi:MAG: DUF5946 family protein [Candidatus Methanoperedens sp.]|nr:DUF5946 family protein [Candidatus Methanoperedens sp.]MCZ7404901.1 DUF5946 family protein [Candidatus Methanoperedens sp.]
MPGQSEQEAYNELSYYTLSHGDPSFIHQYIVDAYAAQHADEKSKPITVAFALIGLYLHIEKHYSGKEVQKAHMRLAKKKRQWPVFDLPEHRGNIGVSDVLRAEVGLPRDRAINEWSASVWEAWSESHVKVADLAQLIWLRNPSAMA